MAQVLNAEKMVEEEVVLVGWGLGGYRVAITFGLFYFLPLNFGLLFLASHRFPFLYFSNIKF